MDAGKFVRLLCRVADDLDNDDLKSMQFLTSGMSGVHRNRLANQSSKEFIFMLKDLNMIDRSDMSFFGELLHNIDRPDLQDKYGIFSGASSLLPEVKVLMFRIARTMTEQEIQNVRFHFDIYDEDYDAMQLMELIETREPVESAEELRQLTSKIGLPHLYQRVVQKAERDRQCSKLMRTTSFCDCTGCDDDCPYRSLWSEKFPHQPAPLFNSERLLSCDMSTDSENKKELLGEGRFGTVYKGD